MMIPSGSASALGPASRRGPSAASARRYVGRRMPFCGIEGIRRHAERPAIADLSKMSIARVMQLLPHRYPFLLINQLEDLDGEGVGDGRQERHHQQAVLSGSFLRETRVIPGGVAHRRDSETAGAVVLEHLGDEHAGKLCFFHVKSTMPVSASRLCPATRCAFPCTALAQALAGFGSCQERFDGKLMEAESARC